ncbi:lipoprotein [Geomonas sp. Red276]
MTSPPRTRSALRLAFAAILVAALPLAAQAQDNRLRRVRVIPHPGSSTVRLFFQDPPEYRVSTLPGRVVIEVTGADAPPFKRFRSYSDGHLSGIVVTPRYHGVTVTIRTRENDPGVRAVALADPSVLSVEVGPSAKKVALSPDILPGREPILAGIQEFVKNYQLPYRTALPFAPTDAKLLAGQLSADEVKLFQQAEGLLYRERAAEALEIFNGFVARGNTAVKALASYRLGEALLLLDRVPEALASFRQGEALWPAYLENAPGIALGYAEARARGGDFAGGRAQLSRLVQALNGTVYAPPLLDRLAQMYERHRDGEAALAIYRTLAVHADGTVAATRARMKLADRDMFTVPRESYPALLERYQAVYRAPGDLAVRDEALFKIALLKALYGAPRGALEAAVNYDTCYPRGIFSTVVKKMREELLLPVYRELYAAKDSAALAKLAVDNRELLCRCFTDPDFAPRLADAFRSAGMLTKELEIFPDLADRNWAASSAPFLVSRIVEDALALGNQTLAQAAAREYLARFPGGAYGGRVREQLARMAYDKGNLKEVAAELAFLAKGGKAEFPESDYYLGKAQVAAGDQRGALQSLSRFVARVPDSSPLALDGLFVLAGAQSSLKEFAGALASYRRGVKLAKGEDADQFLYKMGELHLRLNQVREAREAWEQVAARGGGGTWGKLAVEALNDLKWRLKIAGELP